MNPAPSLRPVERCISTSKRIITEVLVGGADSQRRTVSAAHPADIFSAANVDLLARVTSSPVACINPHDALATTEPGHEAIPGSQFVIVEGAGHVPTAQESDIVTRAFERFLQTIA